MFRMFRRRKGRYEGPAVFVDGSHRPVKKNGDPDYKQKLLWSHEQGSYFYWDGVGSDHLALYHQREIELPIGGPSE